MKAKNSSLFAAMIALAISAPLAHAQEMRPGKWQMTSQTEMIGAPMKMPAQSRTMTICIDNKNKGRPPMAGDDSCKVTTLKTSGNTTNWKLECPGAMSGEGTSTYSGDTYSGNSLLVIKDTDSPPMKMKNTYSGKRIGDC